MSLVRILVVTFLTVQLSMQEATSEPLKKILILPGYSKKKKAPGLNPGLEFPMTTCLDLAAYLCNIR